MSSITLSDDFPSLSLLPFLLSLTLWLLAYYQTVLSSRSGRPDGFASSIVVSNLHSIPLCLLSLASLAKLIPETLPVCWSSAYFVVDVLDCVIRRDPLWAFHGALSLILTVGTSTMGTTRGHGRLRSLSKGFLTEGSTPFLNYWRSHKSYPSFLLFVLSFTLCRILWVPYFLYTTYAVHLEGKVDALLWLSIIFYMLQWGWYVKMIKMVFCYRVPKEVEDQSLQQPKKKKRE